MTHTSTKQPEALRLADKYEVHGFMGDHSFAKEQWCSQTAAELRRQHARIEQLEKTESDLITERDYRDEIIDRMADAVLGTDRAEWSSSYDLIDAAQEVEDFMVQVDATNTKVEKLKAEVEKLQQQLIAEAKKTAEEKLRADQLDKQHTMQARMHAEAVQRIQELETQAVAVQLVIPEGWKLVPEDANRPMLESGKKVLENKVCTPGLTAQAVYKAMIYAAPLPPAAASAKPVDAVLQMIRDQEAEKNAFIAEGICPTCKGNGECGGQFQGGEWTCESCNGTGRYTKT